MYYVAVLSGDLLVRFQICRHKDKGNGTPSQRNQEGPKLVDGDRACCASLDVTTYLFIVVPGEILNFKLIIYKGRAKSGAWISCHLQSVYPQYDTMPG